MSRDPLAAWWTHEVEISAFTDDGAWGPSYGPPSRHRGAIDATTRLVRSATGDEVVSTATVSLPAAVGYLEPGTKVTLPASHGGRTSRVIACQVASGGGAPTPDHVSLHLE